MKTHRSLIVLVLLNGCLPGIAQGQTVTPPKQALTTEYVSPDHRFKIRFPGAPKEFDLPLTETGQVVSHIVIHTSVLTYSLGYTDYPINFERANAIKATLDKARDGSLARIAKEDPRVLVERDISVEGYPGRFLRIEPKGDAILRNEIVLVGNRRLIATPMQTQLESMPATLVHIPFLVRFGQTLPRALRVRRHPGVPPRPFDSV